MTSEIENWEDWELNDIPKLSYNKEQLKILEERKMIEDSEIELISDLVYEKKMKINICEKKSERKDKYESEKRKKELQEKQKKDSLIKKQKRQNDIIHNEKYGSSKLDMYDEMYGCIEDKY